MYATLPWPTKGADMRRSATPPHSGQGGAGPSTGVMSSNSAPHDSEVQAKSYIGMGVILNDLDQHGGNVVAPAQSIGQVDGVRDSLFEGRGADDLGDVALLGHQALLDAVVHERVVLGQLLDARAAHPVDAAIAHLRHERMALPDEEH